MTDSKSSVPAQAGTHSSAVGALTKMDPGLRRDLMEAIVSEAESWIGTPCHHAARVKGAGVDCLMLLAEVYERAGVVGHVDPGFYVPDWHMHSSAERYLEGLLGYTREVAAPAPGDVAMFRFGRTFSHGAIILAWPRVIHALWSTRKVVRGDALQHPLRGRPVRFFSPYGRPGMIGAPA